MESGECCLILRKQLLNVVDGNRRRQQIVTLGCQ
jgi:hypothetical protein